MNLKSTHASNKWHFQNDQSVDVEQLDAPLNNATFCISTYLKTLPLKKRASPLTNLEGDLHTSGKNSVDDELRFDRTATSFSGIGRLPDVIIHMTCTAILLMLSMQCALPSLNSSRRIWGASDL